MWSNCRIYNIWTSEDNKSQNDSKNKLETEQRSAYILTEVKHLTKQRIILTDLRYDLGMLSNCRIYNIWTSEDNKSQNDSQNKLETEQRSAYILTDVKHLKKQQIILTDLLYDLGMWSNCRIYNIWTSEDNKSQNDSKNKLETEQRSAYILTDVKHLTKQKIILPDLLYDLGMWSNCRIYNI